jgi:hypothetical protein
VPAHVARNIFVARTPRWALPDVSIAGFRCSGLPEDPTAYGCLRSAWSPDETTIIFGASSTNREVFTANADGTGVTQIRSSGEGLDHMDADWGPPALDLAHRSGDIAEPMRIRRPGSAERGEEGSFGVIEHGQRGGARRQRCGGPGRAPDAVGRRGH